MDNYYSSDESYDSSDNDEGLLKKALDVDLPDNFNPYSIPRDGNEYLHHVIYERSKMKWLTISDIDRTQFEGNQTLTIPLKKLSVADTRFLPSLEWQDKKLSEFKYFKDILESNNENKQSPTITSFHEEQFMTNFQQRAPKYSTLCRFEQSAKIIMLEILMKYISKMKMVKDSVGAWIFGILVTLDIPLSPSSCHLMREFIITCQNIRSKFSENVEREDCAALNFYICICCRYFGQLDLAD